MHSKKFPFNFLRFIGLTQSHIYHILVRNGLFLRFHNISRFIEPRSTAKVQIINNPKTNFLSLFFDSSYDKRRRTKINGGGEVGDGILSDASGDSMRFI